MTKNFLLLFVSLIICSYSYSQKVKESKSISFEGVLMQEALYDGVFYINVKITKGALAGKTENLYFMVGFNDKQSIECKGTAVFPGAINESDVGKKLKGKIIESIGEFENVEKGTIEKRKCYRPILLDWL